jgi:hypothetical protein
MQMQLGLMLAPTLRLTMNCILCDHELPQCWDSKKVSAVGQYTIGVALLGGLIWKCPKCGQLLDEPITEKQISDYPDSEESIDIFNIECPRWGSKFDITAAAHGNFVPGEGAA